MSPANSQFSTLNSPLIPPGYKQTEVGVIPEEWEAKPLKGKIGISHGFAFASPHFASHGPYRLTTPGHFHEAGGFRDIGEKQKFYVGPVPSDYVLNPGDVIVAMTEQAEGLLGSAAVIPDESSYLHNQRLGRVTVLKPEVELDYLVYVFNSPSYRTKVRETAAGTKVKHTSPEKLLEISVRIPPPPEQRAIAETLSDVDGLLGGLDRLIAKKRDLKQAAMQQLLTGQTRLPGFHGEWKFWTILQIAPNIIDYRGRTPLKLGMEWGSGDIPALSARNVKMGYIDFHEETYFGSDALYTRWMTNGHARKGDLVITTEAPLGNVALIPDDRKYILSQRTVLLQIDPSIASSRFLHQLMMGGRFQQVLAENSSGSTATGIQRKRFEKLELTLPEVSEQTAIAEVLTEMDGELAALEQRREKTRALKQAMMQELLTGRIRLV